MNELLNYQEKHFKDDISLLNENKKRIAYALINYYGKEYAQLIESVIYNIPVYFYRTDAENDLIYQLLGLEVDPNLRTASGAFCSNLSFDKNYKMISNPFIKVDVRFDSDGFLPTIIHEYIHAIMSYGKIEEVGATFEYKTGFMLDIYENKPDSLNKPVRYVIFYRDLEEGLTEYDTHCIVKNMRIENPDLSNSYQHLVDYVDIVMCYPSIRKIINKCRLEGDTFMYKFNNLENGSLIRGTLMGFKNSLDRDIKERNTYCDDIKKKLNRLVLK